jgi:hypothetical protein
MVSAITNTKYCRNTTALESFGVKIGKFISCNPILQGLLNSGFTYKQYGFQDKGEDKYEQLRYLEALIVVLFMMEKERYDYKTFSCPGTICEEDYDWIYSKRYTQYNLPRFLGCITCQAITQNSVLALLTDLGWNYNQKQLNNGIGHMCIGDPSNPNVPCNCNDSIMQVPNNSINY